MKKIYFLQSRNISLPCGLKNLKCNVLYILDTNLELDSELIIPLLSKRNKQTNKATTITLTKTTTKMYNNSQCYLENSSTLDTFNM